MLWALCLLPLVAWALLRRWRLRRQHALARTLHTHIPALPLLGHTYKLLGSDETVMESISDFGRDAIKVGGVSKMLYFDELLLCVADPATAQVILKECLEKHKIMEVFQLVLNNGSFIAPVPIWHVRRKVVMPTFNTYNLSQFCSVLFKYANQIVSRLEKEEDKGSFSFLQYIADVNFNSVCEAIIGVKTDGEDKLFLESVDYLWKWGSYLTMRPWLTFCARQFPFVPFFAKALQKRDNTLKIVSKIIHTKRDEIKRMKEIGHNMTSIPSFLSNQLEGPKHKRLDDDAMQEECLTLIAAGFDSTARATSFVLLLMGRHQDVQDKVYTELQEVLGESDCELTYEDLSRLQYLDAVIKETLRLYPIAPLVVRNIDKDLELPYGVTAVKGCGAIINIRAIHRHPKYWGPDLDQFRPERFFEGEPTDPRAFMPFSNGPRNCVGYRYAMLSLKSTLAVLLRRYRVLTPPGVPQGEPLRVSFGLIISHIDNYMIQITKRNNNK